jgi:hypothetical protein
MRKYFLFVSLLLTCGLFAQTNVFKYCKTGTTVRQGSMSSKSDSLGNFYILGEFENTFNYQGLEISGPTKGETYSKFLLKCNPAGKPIWMNAISGVLSENMISYEKFCINQKGQVAVIFVVSNTSELKIGNRIFSLNSKARYFGIAKFDAQGLLMWTDFIPVPLETSVGPDIEIDNQGNVYISGNFNGLQLTIGGKTIPGYINGTSFFVAKYSSIGEPLWANGCGYDATDSTGYIHAVDIAVERDGSVFLAGFVSGTKGFFIGSDLLKCTGNQNSFIAYYSSSGLPLWAIPYQGLYSITAQQILIDADGNALFACSTNSPNLVINGSTYSSSVYTSTIVSKIRRNGTYVWVSQIFANSSNLLHFAKMGFNENQDISVICDGTSGSFSTIAFRKLNKLNGQTMWNAVTASDENTQARAMKIDDHGNIYVELFCHNYITIDSSTINSSDNNGVECFLKINNKGAIDYIFKHQNSDAATNQVIFDDFGIDAFENLYIVGEFYGSSATLDKFSFSANPSPGMFIAKFGKTTSISGKVIDPYGATISRGLIRLIGYSNYQRSAIVDSADVNSDGTYLFPEVPLGRYILKFEPAKSDINDLMSVYYLASGLWSGALQIQVDKPLPVGNLIIVVPPKQIFTGNNTLAGLVTTLDSTDVFKSAMGKAQPRQKASLARGKPKSDYEIIAETESDENGFFSFTNVEDGDYVLFIDYPGLPVVNPHEVTVSGGQFISNLNYYIGEDYIEGYGDPSVVSIDDPKLSEIEVYPNPSYGAITIKVSDNSIYAKLIVRDAVGRQLKEIYDISSGLTLNNFEPGTYFLSFANQNISKTIKLIVKP